MNSIDELLSENELFSYMHLTERCLKKIINNDSFNALSPYEPITFKEGDIVIKTYFTYTGTITEVHAPKVSFYKPLLVIQYNVLEDKITKFKGRVRAKDVYQDVELKDSLFISGITSTVKDAAHYAKAFILKARSEKEFAPKNDETLFIKTKKTQ